MGPAWMAALEILMEKNAAGLGRLAEGFVAQRLCEMGCEVLARNYHSRFGEIDIIARRGGLLLFVEVKARKGGSLVSPFEAVTPGKQRKILLTAGQYLAENPGPLQPRFDVAAVYMQAGRAVKMEYLENAFTA